MLAKNTQRAISTALYRKVSTKATLTGCSAWPIARTYGFREKDPRKSTFPCHFPGSSRTCTTQITLSNIPGQKVFLIIYFTYQKRRNYISPNFRAEVLWFVLKRFLTIRALPLYIYIHTWMFITNIGTCRCVYITRKVFFLRSLHPEHVIYSVHTSRQKTDWVISDLSFMLTVA